MKKIIIILIFTFILFGCVEKESNIHPSDIKEIESAVVNIIYEDDYIMIYRLHDEEYDLYINDILYFALDKKSGYITSGTWSGHK